MLAVSALLVRFTSRGPVIYRSYRPGIGGEPFACLKFRTMYSDADQRQADLESLNEASGPLFKIRRDPRMTPVGRFLRRYSLDELPQLVNVLRGEMSLVGPRPLPQRDFDQLEDWHKKRYLVTPGMTGLWQISGRSELDFDDLVRLDFLYLERWSVGLDLAILLKTIPAVVLRRGAYLSGISRRPPGRGRGPSALRPPAARAGPRASRCVCETVSRWIATIRASGTSRASSTTSSLVITIGSPVLKRAALALTTITCGRCSSTASRTSSQRIVSPAM